MKKIILGKPYIDIQGDKAKLCSDIQIDGAEHFFRFVVDNEAYGKYLVTENCDAFIIAFIHYACYVGADLYCETPISERLYYQLQSYIKILADNLSGYKEIKIHVPITTELVESEHAVVTGLSCGVDSFYTIMQNLNLEETPNLSLTHLIYNSGMFGAYNIAEKSGERDIQAHKFEVMSKKVSKIAKSLNLQMIIMSFEISDIYEYTHNEFIHNRFLACPMALQKLVGVYYLASGYSASEFHFDRKDYPTFDLITIPAFSTPSLKYYLCGDSVNRFEKTKAIATFPVTYENIDVCQLNDKRINCSRCTKCVRTMLELRACGSLEKYEKSFDIPFFLRHQVRTIGAVIGAGDSLGKSAMRAYRKAGYRIPLSAYIYGKLFYGPVVMKAMPKLKHNTFIRKIYMKLHFHEFIFGERNTIE